MKLNLWRIASYATLFLTATGLGLAVTVDGDVQGWANTAFLALLWTRLEWLFNALAEAKKSHDDEDD